jgi:hypothetical protein
VKNITLIHIKKKVKKKIMNKNFIEILTKAFIKENSTVNDIFVLIYFSSCSEIESWTEIEDVIEETFGEKPDWSECKKLIRKYQSHLKII